MWRCSYILWIIMDKTYVYCFARTQVHGQVDGDPRPGCPVSRWFPGTWLRCTTADAVARDGRDGRVAIGAHPSWRGLEVHHRRSGFWWVSVPKFVGILWILYPKWHFLGILWIGCQLLTDVTWSLPRSRVARCCNGGHGSWTLGTRQALQDCHAIRGFARNLIQLLHAEGCLCWLWVPEWCGFLGFWFYFLPRRNF